MKTWLEDFVAPQGDALDIADLFDEAAKTHDCTA
jgi:hypothetical protein